MLCSRVLAGIAFSVLAIVLQCSATFCQAVAFSDPADVKQIADRIRPQIDSIRIFDNHAHPGWADDPDVDAMTAPPGGEAFRIHADNPEFVVAAKAMFGYPFPDLKPEHARWLADRKQAARAQGTAYFNGVLDKVGVAECLANRVAMPSYLDPKRFQWVFFVDSFLFPFNNGQIAARNTDLGVYLPLQENILKRELNASGETALPKTFDAYLAWISKVLETRKRAGAVAMKFEAAYFRSLQFADPPREQAARTYERYRAGQAPPAAEYTELQDYIARFLFREAARLHFAVHFHTAVGVGEYFNLANGNVMNLEPVLRDPRYGATTFVLLHGGYPFDRAATWLAARRNVYIDSSLLDLLLYPAELAHMLRHWLETYPDKIIFGSDAFPFSDALGVEESYWLAVQSVRSALALALAQMVAAREIDDQQALTMARGYLHDNAARLYARLQAAH